jgi:hypothetical protein
MWDQSNQRHVNAMAKTIASGMNHYAGAFITIHQAVPCILHLENQCGENMKLHLIDGCDSSVNYDL